MGVERNVRDYGSGLFTWPWRDDECWLFVWGRVLGVSDVGRGGSKMMGARGWV